MEIKINTFLVPLSKWFGFKLNPMEDFDVVCQNDMEFLELLLLFEKKFSVNMLDNSRSRKDFSTIMEFIVWASSNPPATKYIIT